VRPKSVTHSVKRQGDVRHPPAQPVRDKPVATSVVRDGQQERQWTPRAREIDNLGKHIISR